MTTTGYIPFADVLAEDLQDPATKAEWDRDTLAREFAIWLLRYRKKHRLTQPQFGRLVRMPQSVISRLESAEHEPSYKTMWQISRALGVMFKIRIQKNRLRFTARKIPTPRLTWV